MLEEREMKRESKIVNKVWGSEEWIVNRDYCGKILNLKKGFRCSIHYHKKKDETFYILEGKVLLELEGKKEIVKQGDIRLIKPNQKHRFTGLEDSKIIEFSTHHNDADSYRDEPSGEVDLEKVKQELENDIN
jgi:mannose-6-phosphate isomerase-like protein (cupin superfamily)